MSYQFKGKKFNEFSMGEEHVTASRTVTEADVVNFAGLSGDFNPLHTDEQFAQKTPFKSRIAHGLLGVSIASGLANQLGIFEGTTIALLSMTINYKGAIIFGDTIRLKLKVAEMKETSKEDRGVIKFDISILNQRDEIITDGQWVVMMARDKVS